LARRQSSKATRSDGAISAALVIFFRSRETTTSSPSGCVVRNVASFIAPSFCACLERDASA
jgi:hypothetical protein